MRVLHLLDRLGRLRQAQHADRHDAIEVGGEQVGDHRVVRADGDVAQLGIGDVASEGEPDTREDDGEVDAPVVEAVVEQAGDRGGGAVAHVDRHAPVRRPAQASPASFLHRELVPAVEAVPVAGAERVDVGGAADLRDVVEVHGEQLHPVAVGVDDRVVELRARTLALLVVARVLTGGAPRRGASRNARRSVRRRRARPPG